MLDLIILFIVGWIAVFVLIPALWGLLMAFVSLFAAVCQGLAAGTPELTPWQKDAENHQRVIHEWRNECDHIKSHNVWMPKRWQKPTPPMPTWDDAMRIYGSHTEPDKFGKPYTR